MRVRAGFVTNSSSTSFILTVHKKGLNLTAKEFVEDLWKSDKFLEYMKSYHFKDTKEEVLQALNVCYSYFPVVQESLEVVFGDEENNPAGCVFDYCLRPGYKTANFTIKFHEYRR